MDTPPNTTPLPETQVPESVPTPAPGNPVLQVPKSPVSYGSVIALVTIVIILIVGAFYIWGQRIATTTVPTTTQTP